MIIDMHVHAFPDKVAAKAIESLESTYAIKCFSDGTVKGLVTSMAESDIDIAVVQPVSTDPKQVVSINTWAAEISRIGNETKPQIISFGTIHPKFDGYDDEMQTIKEPGIKGVKFQPSFQHFYPDDSGMMPVYAELIKAGIIIYFHAGDEIEPADIVYSTPKRLARVLDTLQNEINDYNYRVDYGNIKFVAAHLGGYMMWDGVEQYLMGRDIFLDISYTLGHIDSAIADRIIKNHGSSRILFGSDFPFEQQHRTFDMVSKLDLAEDDKEMIFSSNAIRLLSLPY